MESAVWGLIGTVIGTFASISTSYMTARNTASLSALAAERVRDDQKRVFQRETLLGLQDAISDSFRLVTRAHLEDRAAFRNGTAWGRNMLPDELAENMRLSMVQISLLRARVIDDELRQEIKNFVALATSVTDRVDEASAIHSFATAVDAANRLMDRIGDSLRQQY